MKHTLAFLMCWLAFSAINCAEANGAELCWTPTEGAAIYTLVLTHSDSPGSAYTSQVSKLVLGDDLAYHFQIPEEGAWADWNTAKTEMFMFATGVDGPSIWVGETAELMPQESCSTPGLIPGKKRPIVKGDLNCDGKITIADTLIHLHKINGLSEFQECER